MRRWMPSGTEAFPALAAFFPAPLPCFPDALATFLARFSNALATLLTGFGRVPAEVIG